MPEGDTIFRAARTLDRALAGQLVSGFETVLPHLARVHEDTPLTGRTVERVEPHGKWIVMRFSGGLSLATHMRMSGSWHVYRPGERWQRSRGDMRIRIATPAFEAVGFTIPVAAFHDDAALERLLAERVGPDLLGEEFDEHDALARIREHPALHVGVALLRQHLVAGVGNVYRSEVCFACRVHPERPVSAVSDEDLRCLLRTARRFLQANVGATTPAGIVTYTGLRRTTGRADRSARLWVYGRADQPCRRCGTAIHGGREEDGRVVFWCPSCQG
jgi:endonuclease-8